MKPFFVVLVLASAFASCKGKKKDADLPYFSVLNYIQAQVRHMDTSAYHFTLIETRNGVSDTAVLPGRQFRTYAKDFLSLPDISAKEKKRHYVESNTYDETLNNVLLTYTTEDPDEEVRRETVMLEAGTNGDTHPGTILVNLMRTSNDSTVVKDLTWHVGKRFLVVTKTSKPGQAEQIKTTQVKWE